jgi:Protein of unknown function (DUF4012)
VVRVARAAVLVVLAVVILGLVWVALTGLLARSDVNSVRSDLPRLESDLAAGNESGAAQLVAGMQHRAHAAHARTSGPAWWVLSRLPTLGTPLRTIRDGTTIVDDLANSALPPALSAGEVLDPTKLRTGPDQIDPVRLASATAPLAEAANATASVQSAARRLPSGTWLGPANTGRQALIDDVDRLHDGLSDLAVTSRLLPATLGQGGTKRYFVAFQTEAEARGLGGLPGDYAIIQATDGRLTFTRFGSDSDLSGVHAHVSLGREFNQRYESDFDSEGTFANSDASPHFPYVAQIWMSMWQTKFHQHLDGAIATDPTALSYLLAATGAVRLPDGEVLTSKTAVAFFESDVYAKFGTHQAARKSFQVQAAQVVASAVIHQRSADLLAFAKGLKRAVDERRLLVYTSNPATQQALAAQPISGEIPITTKPYMGVVVNDSSANKLDYYLDRSVTYSRSSCSAGAATVTVTLHSTTPKSGLPSYVRGTGQDSLLVSLYGTNHSSVASATIDGKVAFIDSESERGHTVTTTSVPLNPGQSRTLVFHVHEPRATGPLMTLTQPLVRPLHLTVHAPNCPSTG